jgi:hypothetical protein
VVTTVDTIELETKVKEMYRHVAQEPGGEWPCLAPIARTPIWPLTCGFGGAEGTRTPDPLNRSMVFATLAISRPFSATPNLTWDDSWI